MELKECFAEGALMKSSRLLAAVAILASTDAIAADLLPLKNGIYVPTKVACKGATNADIVNYWGGKSGIGVAQAECTIKKLTRKGSVYTFTDECRDLQSGEAIEGGTTVLTIRGPTAFGMFGTSYRYCGSKVQF
jgi:hypothetical protein